MHRRRLFVRLPVETVKPHPLVYSRPFHQRRAVALVIVLAMLAILSTLLVAFMGQVSTENSAATTAAHGIEAKAAYDEAINLAMSQIRDATRDGDGAYAWASQPGVIRTFDAQGHDANVFKLYSSSQMKMKAGDYHPSDSTESGIIPTSLNTTPTGFVNLNEPVLVPVPGDANGRVEAHFPIVNPSVRLTMAGGEPIPESNLRSQRAMVDGFYTPKMLHPSGQKDMSNNPVLSLPMRVKWLYQLKDGTLVAPDAGNRLTGASRANPPVARFAFWADDEGGKVNVNTASEYTYWDTPQASCQQESGKINTSNGSLLYDPTLLALGASQPSKREYQRFPGHPATTCLSPVLRWLAPGLTDVDFKEAIYRMTPRIAGGPGSSMGGSRTTDKDFQPDSRIYDRDRLYATLDEYWFRPDRSPIASNGFYPVFRELGSGNQFDTPFTNLTPEALDRVRFFLTANSRSPELNLWGMPRVSIWPVAEKDSFDLNTSKRTGYDDLITFCSTVATKPYVFARRNPWSTTDDFENVGAEVRGIDPVTGVDKIISNPGRNKQLIDKYLRRLTKLPVPGVGHSFDTKYGAKGPFSGPYTEMDRILLSIFDYIRSTNLVDTGRASSTGYPLAYTPGYSPKFPQDYSGGTKPSLGSGQVMPTVRLGGVGGIKGFGRCVTIGELGLMFYADASSLDGEPILSPSDLQANVPVRCVLLPEMFTVSPGYPALSEGYGLRIAEEDEGGFPKPFSVNVGGGTKQLNIAPGVGLVNFVEVDTWRAAYGRFFMPTRGFTNQFLHDNGIAAGAGGGRQVKTFSKSGSTPKERYSRYPFYSVRFLLPRNGASSFHFNGGTFKIEILSLGVTDAQHPPPDPVEGDVVQRLYVKFPPADLPYPSGDGASPFQKRIPTSTGATEALNMITAGDVVRTMEPCGFAKGDYRLIAGNYIVTSDMFATSGTMTDYSSTKMRVHNFRLGHGDVWSGAGAPTFTGANGGSNVYATLSAGATPRGDKKPKVAVAANGSLSPGDPTVTGDYDRGLSKQTDGPFINKPDEGNTRLNLTDDPAGGGGIPYFRGGGGYEEVGESFFSPNRMIPSAIMFGSLPSGVLRNRPFETLLFSPPVSNLHYGASSPPDHYLLDLFQMPVVEPYAISEPLSYSGRINLNTRIAPFGYVKVGARNYLQRDTGLISVLTGMKQMALPTTAFESGHHEKPLERTDVFRFDLDIPGILNKVVNPYLDANGYFRSPTQICELDLYTTDFTAGSNRRNYWEAHNITGDNQRERAYAQIYPRLTTKSNVFTVHAWGQSIAKNPSTKDDAWDTFDESADRVMGDYRGSTMVERFIDPNDPALAGYDAANDKALDLERYYRFRVLNSKRFPGE